MKGIQRHLTQLLIVSLLFICQPGVLGSSGFSMPDTIKAHRIYTTALEKYEAGDFQEAVDMFGDAARLFKRKRMWERVIDCHLFVTRARSLNADEEGLLEYCLAALELSERRLGKNHPSTGDCHNRLGELYYYGHKNDLARSCFDNALNIYSLDGDPDSLAMAKVYSNIGGVKMNLSEYDSAKVYVQKALDIQLGLLDSLDMKLLPTYNTMGALNYYLGYMDQAIYNFDKTLQIRLNKYGANHHEVASSFNNLGSAYEKKKEFHKAVDLHQDALNIRRNTLDSLHPNIALSLNNLANAWYGLGDYEKSNECHSEALRLRKQIYGDNHRDIAMSYANIGHNLVLQDNPAEATFYFGKVVPIMINLYGPDHLLTSDAYANLGLPFYYAGVYDSAFYYMFKALRIRENIQDGVNGSIARSYNNIGALYKDNGDYELALSYYKKSAEVYVAFLGENCNPLAGSFNNMGEVYLETGDYKSSYEHFRRSLDIDMANLGPDNPRLASRYLNLGAVAAKMGKPAESIELNMQALHLHVGAYGENSRLTGSIYRNIAMDYIEMDSLDLALNYLYRAIDILKEIYGEKHFALSSYFTQVGQLLVETGEIELARENLFDGLAVNFSGEIDPEHLENTDTEKILDKNQFIETLAAITKYYESILAPNERKEILSRNLIIYQLIADISVELRETYRSERSKLQALKKWDYLYSEGFNTAAGLYEITGEEDYFNRAFRFSGLKKASALLDAILMSQAMENSGIPDTIIHLERTLLASLEGHKQNLYELDNTAGAEDKRESIENEINSIAIRLNELYLDLDQNYPKYNKLLSSYPQNMPEDIGSALDPKALLLDFMVSDSTVFVIVISNEGHWIEKVEVPADFANRVNHLLRSVKKYRIDDFVSTSKEIYSTLLEPLEKHFTGIEKIIAIPDGYLLLLPFDILIGHEGPENSNDLVSQDYFIKRFETVSHYSTELWIRSMQVNQEANSTNSPFSGFIGFAPVFDKNHDSAETVSLEKAMEANSLATNDTSYTHRSVVDRMSLQELPFSLHEVSNLAAMFAERGDSATLVLHADATERNFREKSVHYRFIHIATHGVINPEKPELSGLVFWKDTSDQIEENPQLFIAEKENDGVLYTKEMYNLLLNADLVTLSACETGAGQLVKGEGLLSFVRGFTFAGVPNVLISYWKVNDKTTADFMVDFYGAVLSGDSYPSALRKAKLEAISDNSSAFPATWGTFVLIGY